MAVANSSATTTADQPVTSDVLAQNKRKSTYGDRETPPDVALSKIKKEEEEEEEEEN